MVNKWVFNYREYTFLGEISSHLLLDRQDSKTREIYKYRGFSSLLAVNLNVSNHSLQGNLPCACF